MKQAVSADLLVYADDSCLSFQEIDSHLRKKFNNLCEWLFHNKVSFHFVRTKVNIFCLRRNALTRTLTKTPKIIILVVYSRRHNGVWCLVKQWLSQL